MAKSSTSSAAAESAAHDSATSEPSPNDVSALRQQAQEKFGPLGQTIAEAFPALILSTVSGATFGRAIDPCAFKAFFDSVLVAAGNPSDPVEAMLIQQLVWAHHQIGNLAGKAAHPATLQEVAIYNQALARILAEFRRSTLALRDYRSGPSAKQVTIVKQQNVALVDSATRAETARKKDHDTELRSNPDRLSQAEPIPDRPTDCGSPEPDEVPRPDHCRSPEAARNGHGEPALAALNGTSHGRW